MIRILFTVLALYFSVGISDAATVTAESCSQAHVSTAITAADTGDTVQIPAGNCSWTGGISFSKSINLRGAGNTSTYITSSAVQIFTSSGDNTTISHMNLTSPSPVIQIYGDGWRIHDNILNSPGATKVIGVHIRGISSNPDPTGLIDNNQFNNARIYMFGTAQMLSEGASQHALWATALNLGTAQTVYIEDNAFNMTDGGNVLDAQYAGHYAARYNTITSPDWGYTIEIHGVQGLERGVRKWEVYRNNLIGSASKIGPIFIRSGTGIIFDNTISGSWSNQTLRLDIERGASSVTGAGKCDGTSSWDGNISNGYPCRDQIGRGPDSPQWVHSPAGAYTQPLVPAYFWGNRNTSAGIMALYLTDGSTGHLGANRDFYQEAASFGGTAGVGTGLLSARPATCTAGVGYWATDQGTWNKMPGGEQGVLYKCVSTNTWDLYYTPYEYPHPLRGESTPDPVCSPSRRDLCDVSNCETTGEGYWYLGVCNATPPASSSNTRLSIGGKRFKINGTELVITTSNP